MYKKRLTAVVIALLAAALCAACFIGCGSKETLVAPQNLVIADEKLSWDDVEGAAGYEVEIDGELYETEGSELDIFLITCEPKTYSMRVRAIGNSKKYNKSDWSDAEEYTLKYLTEAMEFRLINNNREYEMRISEEWKSRVRGKFLVPKSVQGLPVTSIAKDAFKDRKELTGIIIPDSIKTIGTSAFKGCEKLSRVGLPSGLKKIEGYLFDDCVSLENIDIPDSVTSIGTDAFRGCTNLSEITIPDSVTSIAGGAFSGCSSLKEISLPAALRYVERSSFGECDSLTNIKIDPENKVFKFDGDCLINLPDNSVVYGLKTAVIPDYVTSIASHAFSYSGITEITVPGNIKALKTTALSGCEALKKITIESGVEEIVKTSIESCPMLEEIVLPDTLISFTDNFVNCPNLKSITMTGNKTNPVYAVEGNCVIRKEDNTLLAGCMTSDIPDYVERIEGAYDGYPVTRVTVKGNRKTEKEYGVIELPVGLKYLWGFTSCKELKTVQIPDEVTEISESAFAMCDLIESVILTNKSKLKIVPSKAKISNATIYTSFDEMPDGVTLSHYQTILGCEFKEEDGELYVDSIAWDCNVNTVSGKNIISYMARYGFPGYAPSRKGYKFTGWAKDARDGDLLGELTLFPREDSDNGFVLGGSYETFYAGETLSFSYKDFLDLPDGAVLYAVWEPV